MKRVFIILGCVLVLATSFFEIDSYRRHARIQREMSKLRVTELPSYAGFLKPGMTRSAVEHELDKRSIHFGAALDLSGGSNLIVQIKRLPSSEWYCSTEDIGIKMIFLSDGAPRKTITLEDPLEALDVFHQLETCL